MKYDGKEAITNLLIAIAFFSFIIYLIFGIDGGAFVGKYGHYIVDVFYLFVTIVVIIAVYESYKK